MIAHLKGKLHAIHDDSIVLDVNGVGYRVYLSQLNLGGLPPVGTTVELEIATVVREDALDLYGFRSDVELRIYRMLNSISGIGPKQALNFLSNSRPEELARAIADGNVSYLESLRGVGRKTAEKVVLELKGSIGKLFKQSGATQVIIKDTPWRRDLTDALTQLGYRRHQIDDVLLRLDPQPDQPVETMLRDCLRLLGGAKTGITRTTA